MRVIPFSRATWARRPRQLRCLQNPTGRCQRALRWASAESIPVPFGKGQTVRRAREHRSSIKVSRDRHEIHEEDHDNDQTKPRAGEEVHRPIDEEHEDGEDQRPHLLIPKADRDSKDDYPYDQDNGARDGPGRPEHADQSQSAESDARSAEEEEQAEHDDEESEDADQDRKNRDAQW